MSDGGGAAAAGAQMRPNREAPKIMQTDINTAFIKAKSLFNTFLPDGTINTRLNYQIHTVQKAVGRGVTIEVRIVPVDEKGEMKHPISFLKSINEDMLGVISISNDSNGIRTANVETLLVGAWSGGQTPRHLMHKGIGYFLLLIMIYISRMLGVYTISLDDVAEKEGYYEYMGFKERDPYATGTKERYYYLEPMWKNEVTNVFEKLFKKNDQDRRCWQWREEGRASIAEIKSCCAILPVKGGRRFQSKRHHSKRKSKRRRTKRRKTKRRKTKRYRRKSRSRRKNCTKKNGGMRSLKALKSRRKDNELQPLPDRKNLIKNWKR